MRNSLERFLEQSASKPSRRAVLRGAGVAMTLPWLESVSALGATTGTSPYPQRFAAVFMGNGINGNHWWSKGSGDAMQLSKSLEPLAPIKKKINVINGLFNEPAVGEGIHPGQTGNLLSGAPLQRGSTACSRTAGACRTSASWTGCRMRRKRFKTKSAPRTRTRSRST